MEKNNNKLVIFLLIIIICLLAVGGFLGYKLLFNQNNSKTNLGGSENNNSQLDGAENQYTNYDYNINNIKNIVVEVPDTNANDPEMKNVTITNKNEFSDILSNVTNLELVGKMPSVGFLTNVTITINYNGDPSTKIIILDNGNVAINFSVGAGESGYAEYKIANKNLATELKNKYQQLDVDNNKMEVSVLETFDNKITVEKYLNSETTEYYLQYTKKGNNKIVWSYRTESDFVNQFEKLHTIKNLTDVIYINNKGNIVALNKTTGKVVWQNNKYKDNGVFDTIFLDKNNNLYLHRFIDGTLTIIDTKGVTRNVIKHKYFADRECPNKFGYEFTDENELKISAGLGCVGVDAAPDIYIDLTNFKIK